MEEKGRYVVTGTILRKSARIGRYHTYLHTTEMLQMTMMHNSYGISSACRTGELENQKDNTVKDGTADGCIDSVYINGS